MSTCQHTHAHTCTCCCITSALCDELCGAVWAGGGRHCSSSASRKQEVQAGGQRPAAGGVLARVLGRGTNGRKHHSKSGRNGLQTPRRCPAVSRTLPCVLPCPARCLKSLSPTPPVSPSPCPDALAHWLSAKQLANALCLCRCPTRPPNVSSGPAACSAAARTRRHTVMAVLQLALPWCACLLDALASCPAPVLQIGVRLLGRTV